MISELRSSNETPTKRRGAPRTMHAKGRSQSGCFFILVFPNLPLVEPYDSINRGIDKNQGYIITPIVMVCAEFVVTFLMGDQSVKLLQQLGAASVV